MDATEYIWEEQKGFLVASYMDMERETEVALWHQW